VLHNRAAERMLDAGLMPLLEKWCQDRMALT
jgi:hypothetical protein